MSNVNFFMILLSSSLIYVAYTQRIKYLNSLFENEICDFENGVLGICRKISDCLYEYENYRKNQTVLKVCSFIGSLQNNLICCSVGSISRNPFENKIPKNRKKINKELNLIDLKICRDEFLKYRKQSINPNHYGNALYNNFVPINQDTCEHLSRLNLLSGFNHWDHLNYYCELQDGNFKVIRSTAHATNSTENSPIRPNMASVGWTQENKLIIYRCGGSIITDRFIVSAAHCKFHESIQADTIRLGDRFMIIQKNIEYVQQLKIQEFILHPNYISSLNYNDIAMIKTSETIIFNVFVIPSCIGDIDVEKNEFDGDLTIGGYRELSNAQNSSNSLLEMNVDIVSSKECNKTYEFDTRLPFGIVDSQICVKSNISDTCFSDSGSPLQFKSAHEVYHRDFNTTYLSTVYETSTVLGIVSFGIRCGLQAPTVFTKLSFYRDWMKSIIENS